MRNHDKTKNELINELAKLRQRIAKLEALESKYKKAEEALRREKDWREQYLNIAGVMLAIVNADEKITMINKKGCEILGYKEKELIGKNWFDLLVPQRIRDEVKDVFHKLMAGDIRPVEYYENPLLTKDGEERLIAFHNAVIRGPNDKIVVVLFSAEDITERKKTEEALTQERNLLQALIDNIPDAIYFKDDKNRFIRVNKARADLSGTTPENMIGKTDFDFFPQEQAKEAFADDSRVMESNRPMVSKIEKITHADGTEHWFSVTKIPRHNEKGGVIGTMGISRDITTRKQQEKHLAYMTTHDTLTGLANRALFRDHFTLALARAQRNRQKFPIMLLDLDNFKNVNDRLGHSVGDKLLQVAGDRIKGILRKADTVARTGGDEFLLLLPGTTRTEDIDVVAQKILAAFQKPFLLGDHQIRTTTSIGIAIYPSDGKEADTLIKNADIAMYRVKRYGRNNYQYYTTTAEGKPTG